MCSSCGQKYISGRGARKPAPTVEDENVLALQRAARKNRLKAHKGVLKKTVPPESKSE